MSANFARLSARYYNNTVYNDTDKPIRCEFNEFLDSQFIQKASDWVCAVERFEVHLQGVPFQRAFTVNGTDADGNAVQVVMPDTYSITGFYGALADKINAAGSVGGNIEFYEQPGGVLRRRWGKGGNSRHSIDWSTVQVNGTARNLSWIANAFNWFDNSADNGDEEKDNYSYAHLSAGPPDVDPLFPYRHLNNAAKDKNLGRPVTDLGDELQKVIIATTLPIVSDTVGQGKQDILTDFAIPLSYSNQLGGAASVSGMSLSTSQVGGYIRATRQQLQVIPSVRRYLNLISDAPIRVVRVAVFYENNRTGEQRVPLLLPPGGYFSIKIGFYNRN